MAEVGARWVKCLKGHDPAVAVDSSAMQNVSGDADDLTVSHELRGGAHGELEDALQDDDDLLLLVAVNGKVSSWPHLGPDHLEVVQGRLPDDVPGHDLTPRYRSPVDERLAHVYSPSGAIRIDCHASAS